MQERAEKWSLGYQAELHPIFSYKGNGDYDPENADIDVDVEFVPSDGKRFQVDLKTSINDAIKKLNHDRFKPLRNTIDKLFETTKIKKIVAMGLGTTNNRDLLYEGPNYYKAEPDEDDIFDERERNAIQLALMFETAKAFGCPLKLQEPAYLNAEKALFPSFDWATIVDDPDGVRKIDESTLVVAWGAGIPLNEMVWWTEKAKDRLGLPAAVLSDDFGTETYPETDKMSEDYEGVVFLEREAATDPFPNMSLWIRKDLLNDCWEQFWDNEDPEEDRIREAVREAIQQMNRGG